MWYTHSYILNIGQYNEKSVFGGHPSREVLENGEGVEEESGRRRERRKRVFRH